MINRLFKLQELLQNQKALVIYGPRRVGKTTLLKDYLKRTQLKYKFDSGDNITIQNLFNSQDFEKINAYAGGYELIAIDEAQQIKNIGMGLKILVDNNPELKIIVTGSSSFDLSQKIGEPLTGRKKTILLYPFSQQELLNKYNKHELKEKLSDFLIFGSYPEVITTEKQSDKIEILTELVNSYLLKDILSLGGIRGAKELLDLLKLLAFQVGSEVSLNELATQIKMDVKTVARYIDILEKGFVIKRLAAFSRNLRKEIAKKSKYYFWDNGIRNAVILQFNGLSDRNDIGSLFENFIMMERTKYISNNFIYTNSYFWRTYNGNEIDIIEERDGKLNTYELKYAENAKVKQPKEFFNEYSEAQFHFINSANYLNFILP
ncbi:MAG: AAA ATPase [Ignavibacteria bacterium]|nr:MAG: AAA ATPase [Ignavibacteria bacterium]KAF0160626.1 MAG: AAA ATPase [Ignavibacteria bacterium]